MANYREWGSNLQPSDQKSRCPKTGAPNDFIIRATINDQCKGKSQYVIVVVIVVVSIEISIVVIILINRIVIILLSLLLFYYKYL